MHSKHDRDPEKRMYAACVPDNLRPKVTSANETSGMCDVFIAEFKIIANTTENCE